LERKSVAIIKRKDTRFFKSIKGEGKGFYVGNGRVKDGEFFPCLFWEWGYNPRKRRVGKRVFLEDDDLIGE
jgi:hypothetical protein